MYVCGCVCGSFRFDTAQTLVSRFLQVSSFFEDEGESPVESDETKVQSWSCVCVCLIVVVCVYEYRERRTRLLIQNWFSPLFNVFRWTNKLCHIESGNIIQGRTRTRESDLVLLQGKDYYLLAPWLRCQANHLFHQKTLESSMFWIVMGLVVGL